MGIESVQTNQDVNKNISVDDDKLPILDEIRADENGDRLGVFGPEEYVEKIEQEYAENIQSIKDTSQKAQNSIDDEINQYKVEMDEALDNLKQTLDAEKIDEKHNNEKTEEKKERKKKEKEEKEKAKQERREAREEDRKAKEAEEARIIEELEKKYNPILDDRDKLYRDKLNQAKSEYETIVEQNKNTNMNKKSKYFHEDRKKERRAKQKWKDAERQYNTRNKD